MTDLKHDPEYPYVVLTPGGNPIARLRSKNDAKDLAGMASGRVIEDTTPKPKIPEDAEYVFVTSKDNEPDFANKYGNEWYWHTTGEFIDSRDLLEYIGSSEVTVLVRKEES